MMKINGVDIKQYGVQQWNVEPMHCEISNKTEWMAGAALPSLLPGTVGIKKFKVSILVKGDTRADIWERSSKIMSLFLSPAIIELDWFKHSFYMVAVNTDYKEIILDRSNKLIVELAGYEFTQNTRDYSFTVSNNVQQVNIENKGNLDSPATIKILRSGKGEIQLTGLILDPFEDKMKNIRIMCDGVSVYAIDGENGMITRTDPQTGELQNAGEAIKEMSGIPMLKSGQNTLTYYSNTWADINVSFKDLFL